MLRLDYERTKIPYTCKQDMLITLRFDQRVRSSEGAKETLVMRFFIRSTCDNSNGSNIRSTNLIADLQWRDLMKIWFVINSSHDWSLKCIFFKWNIKTFYYILSFTHTHTCTSYSTKFVTTLQQYCRDFSAILLQILRCMGQTLQKFNTVSIE